MKLLKSFFLIVNLQTFIVTGLSMLATSLCHHYKLTADFSLTLVGVAIVFPIVFSINSAYRRREEALANFADLKAHGLAIYFASCDWVKTDAGSEKISKNIRRILKLLLVNIRELFLSKEVDRSAKTLQLYKTFSDLSAQVQLLREYLPSGELSRLNQFVSKMMIAFNKMKIIYNYRTPITLRAYSKVFIYTFPVLYAPYFATFHVDFYLLGYVMPILYSFILVSLDNIQDHLEDPYDQVGEDDIIIDAESYDNLLATKVND
jgi:hypothetical protein